MVSKDKLELCEHKYCIRQLSTRFNSCKFVYELMYITIWKSLQMYTGCNGPGILWGPIDSEKDEFELASMVQQTLLKVAVTSFPPLCLQISCMLLPSDDMQAVVCAWMGHIQPWTGLP